jgi:hypothetical protein
MSLEKEMLYDVLVNKAGPKAIQGPIESRSADIGQRGDLYTQTEQVLWLKSNPKHRDLFIRRLLQRKSWCDKKAVREISSKATSWDITPARSPAVVVGQLPGIEEIAKQ